MFRAFSALGSASPKPPQAPLSAPQAESSGSEGEGADDEAMFRTDAALAAVLRANADAKTSSKEARAWSGWS